MSADARGSGAFASVHIGTHKQSMRTVAIKVISKEKSQCTGDYMEEVHILRKLDHIGIVAFEAAEETENELFLVLEQ